MSSKELERVRGDLATLKLALSPDLPFKPSTVRFAFAVALGGLLSLIWALHPYPVPAKWEFAIPMLLAVLPMAITLVHFVAVHRHEECSVSAGEIKRAHLNYVPYIVAVLSLIFLILAVRAGWVPVAFVSHGFLFIFGAAITATALTEPMRRYNLGLSVPMLAGAFAGLLLEWPFALTFGVVLSIGGLASGLIMIVQLRRQARNHAAD